MSNTFCFLQRHITIASGCVFLTLIALVSACGHSGSDSIDNLKGVADVIDYEEGGNGNENGNGNQNPDPDDASDNNTDDHNTDPTDDIAEPEPTQSPKTPSNFKVESSDSARVVLTWVQADETTSYEIYRDTTADITLGVDQLITTLLVTYGTRYIDQMLAPQTTYYYAIKACNSSGCSEESTGQATTMRKMLNDTGVTKALAFVSANESPKGEPCDNAVNERQDCRVGRDIEFPSNADGYAGFSFTKLGSNGDPLVEDVNNWSCIHDNVTGLTWEAKNNDGGLHDRKHHYSWYNSDVNKEDTLAEDTEYNWCHGYDSRDSATYCNTQAFVARVNETRLCGYDDWRLPQLQELHSLVRYEDAASFIDTDYFPNNDNANSNNTHYWAENLPHQNADKLFAWVISFDGIQTINVRAPVLGASIRLVRGTFFLEEADRYTDNQNGTITDHATHLMWKRCSEGFVFNAQNNTCSGNAEVSTLSDVLGTADSHVFASYDDWRVPNIKELTSLMVTDQSPDNSSNLYINTTMFPDTTMLPTEEIGEETPYLSSSFTKNNTKSWIWLFRFQNGLNLQNHGYHSVSFNGDYYVRVDGEHYVRFVRDVQ